MLLTTKMNARGITKMDSSKSSNYEELAIPLAWEEVPKFLDDEARNHEIDLAQDLDINANIDDFIALISHELRTPLTCIRGAIGLLLFGRRCWFDDETPVSTSP